MLNIILKNHSFIILIIAAIATGGCASRLPIGTINLKVNLDKLLYKEIASTDGESSTKYSALFGITSSNGRLTYIGGPSVSIPLTEEIRLIGLNRLNINQVSFTQSLKWGENNFSIPLLYPENILIISGNGPSGNIQRYVGELAYENNAETYEIKIIKNAVK